MKLANFFLGFFTVVQYTVAQVPFHTPDYIGSGNALSFDGTNDFVLVGNDNTIDFDDGDPFTVEAWVRTAAPNDHQFILQKKDVGSTTVHLFTIQISDGNFVFKVGNDQDNEEAKATSTTTLVADTWYHVAGVSDGNDVFIYVNGIEEDMAGPIPSATLNTHDLYIGRRFNNDRHLNGQLDEIRIWSEARTTNEIKDNMCRTLNGNENKLEAYWRFNSGSGNTLDDATSNNNDGTLN